MGKADDIMTIRHLRIFIEVAECGKMSAAAEKLFISQPTVSQAIKELEEHYGVLLFERLNKRLYITEKGKKLLSYARKVVKQFYDMEEMMLPGNICGENQNRCNNYGRHLYFKRDYKKIQTNKLSR